MDDKTIILGILWFLPCSMLGHYYGWANILKFLVGNGGGEDSRNSPNAGSWWDTIDNVIGRWMVFIPDVLDRLSDIIFPWKYENRIKNIHLHKDKWATEKYELKSAEKTRLSVVFPFFFYNITVESEYLHSKNVLYMCVNLIQMHNLTSSPSQIIFFSNFRYSIC